MRLLIGACILLGVILSSVIASAQAPVGGGPGPVLGIVEIPKMFAVDKDTGVRAPQGVLRLYAGPNSQARMLTDITSPEAIDDAEYAYEEAGALVYGRERGYFLIRTSRGLGWLPPDDAGAFHSLQTLIS